ncbi:hypothetical protein RhiirA1_477364 [Rhizophagus irregularis]|uniref:Uncharacterized protein n=1 Tax=Rhizophagus irregularis TaxID=588596 RepID=A0A2N0QTT7_9GLOM|nr:hypothetical protein RhiirA1_477364 [Rhizophagus irregularis]
MTCVSVPFTLNWYRHLSFWIDIGALYFGLVLAFFTLDCFRSVRHFTLDRYRRNPSLWIHIGCDLWILGINWHRLGLLDRYQLASVSVGTSVQTRKPLITDIRYQSGLSDIQFEI